MNPEVWNPAAAKRLLRARDADPHHAGMSAALRAHRETNKRRRLNKAETFQTVVHV